MKVTLQMQGDFLAITSSIELQMRSFKCLLKYNSKIYNFSVASFCWFDHPSLSAEIKEVLLIFLNWDWNENIKNLGAKRKVPWSCGFFLVFVAFFLIRGTFVNKIQAYKGQDMLRFWGLFYFNVFGRSSCRPGREFFYYC